MLQHFRNRRVRMLAATAVVGCFFAVATLFIPSSARAAINPLPVPPPSFNSYGLEATKQQPPPKEPPVITSPGGGTSGNGTVTVSGLCKDGLLVQVYDNDVLVGAVDCKNGSFSLQITLFPGQNDITAIQYDELGQASPVSNLASITYNVSVEIAGFGTPITLTSNYGRRAANPGATLSWPLILSGGVGPYAFSIDWGDGSKPDLKSVAVSGPVNIDHVYKSAGLYHVTIRVTDVNGVTAFLQLVAIANGNVTKPTTSDAGNTKTVVVTKVMWVPAAVCLVLLPAAYWLGRRSELVSLHNKLEKEMSQYKDL